MLGSRDPVTAVRSGGLHHGPLTISGLPTRRFAFEAFLPMDKKERQQILDELKEETRTIVIYEAPHRPVLRLCVPGRNAGRRPAGAGVQRADQKA